MRRTPVGRAPRPGDPLLGRRHARGRARASPSSAAAATSPGSTVLHWADGADGGGALLTGDTIMVGEDRRTVGFMYSFPNYIPLNARAVQHIGAMVEPFEFEHVLRRLVRPQHPLRGKGGGALLRPPLSARHLGSWTTLARTAAARRGGGALAVDLRRARAAQRRVERAEARAGRGRGAAALAVARLPRRLRRPRAARLRAGVVRAAWLEPVRRSRRRSGAPTSPARAAWSTRPPARARPTRPGSGRCWSGCATIPAGGRRKAAAPPLRVLWITPLRALAGDTEAALRAPVEDLGLPWTVETRTGDTPARIRARQRERLPTALVTTPESLTLLLTREDAHDLFDHLELVVVDEWHELLASKRGVQTELALARLRRFRPSASHPRPLGHARQSRRRPRRAARPRGGRHAAARASSCGASSRRRSRSTPSFPSTMERFPWSGQIGPAHAARGRPAPSRRARARWSSPTPARPPRSGTRRCWPRGPTGRGSWRSTTARWIAPPANGWRTASATGKLRCVVCTSTLDLGVDFTPVDRVLQIGSPKAVGRLIQRAGRSGHQPGAVSRLTCVPTNALELVDVAAARAALRRRAHRGTPPGRAPARPARAARRHRRPGRRLPPGRALRRGAHDQRLSRPDPRANGPGCSTSSPTAATRSAPTPNTARWWSRTVATS